MVLMKSLEFFGFKEGVCKRANYSCTALNQKDSSVRRVQRGADGQGASFYTRQALTIWLPKSGSDTCVRVSVHAPGYDYANLNHILCA